MIDPALRRPKVGFIGLGLMGLPMARNLMQAGHSLRIWNRTPSRCAALVSEGATVSDSPAQLAGHVDVLILMLTDAAAVSDVLFAQGVAAVLAPHALVIDMGSIAPAAAQKHHQLLGKRGIAYVDAPVSGGTKGATERTLAIMVGGEPEAFARARPLLEALGRPTHVGPSGAGQICKLANQMIVAITLGAVSEALAFASRAGADPAAVRQALAGGFADSRILTEHGQRMITGNFTPGGTVRNQIKDLDAASEVAQRHQIELPLLALTQQRFMQLATQGDGLLDHSAIYKLFAPKQG